MSEDIGLQRAIWASMQQQQSRPAPAPRPTPQPRLQPTQPRPIARQAPYSAAGMPSGSGSGTMGTNNPVSRSGSFGHQRARDIRPTVPVKKEITRPVAKASSSSSASSSQPVATPVRTRSNPPGARSPAVGGGSGASKTPAKSTTSAGAAARPRRTQETPSDKKNDNNKATPEPSQYPPNVDPNFAAQIEAEILDKQLNVQWDDVAGLEEAKQLLNEAILLPLLVPEFFSGGITPWKGVLLFGPPGTGKTMLAKAVATSANTTFFNISASALLSRYHGESEKMVKTLFAMARHHAPATIFFDEIDALMSKRSSGGGGTTGGGGGGEEVARRVKAEMLQQIDGVNSGDISQRVIVLATTNTPWDLDEAMRRRLEKRIYVPLPCQFGRSQQLKLQTKSLPLAPEVNLDTVAEACDGFSGADMNILCRDAAMMRMRRVIANKKPQEIAEMKSRGEFEGEGMGTVTAEDFEAARRKINPSVSEAELGKYKKWFDEFGSN